MALTDPILLSMMTHTAAEIERAMSVAVRDRYGLYVICAGCNYITVDEIEAMSRSGRTITGQPIVAVFTNMRALLEFCDMFHISTSIRSRFGA